MQMAFASTIPVLLAAISFTGALSLAIPKDANSITISHSGAIQHDQPKSSSPAWTPEALEHIAMLRQNGFSAKRVADTSGAPVETCNDDFELGTENTNVCNSEDPGHQAPIDEKALCKSAADAANVTSPRDTFEIPSTYWESRPRNCFMFPCTEDPKKVCFFFNENPVTPKTPVGTPVCLRRKYVNGTENTIGSCPTGYNNILDIETCRKASKCWTFCDGDQFDINKPNMSKYHDHPQGCYINQKDGCFYFNTVRESMGTPTNPVGMPVCMVSQALKFPDAVPTFGMGGGL